MGRKISIVGYAAIALAGSFLCGSEAQAAAALKIDPRCAKFSDKLGCTCALLNGGRIYTDGQGRGGPPPSAPPKGGPPTRPSPSASSITGGTEA
jgi:hypothetical protein